MRIQANVRQSEKNPTECEKIENNHKKNLRKSGKIRQNPTKFQGNWKES